MWLFWAALPSAALVKEIQTSDALYQNSLTFLNKRTSGVSSVTRPGP